MKNLINRAALFLMISAAASGAAFATSNTKNVRFNQAVTVNGTLVKAGTYKVSFDDQTGELTIFNGKTTVATAPARLDKLEMKSPATYSTKTVGESTVLSSVNMKDDNLATIIVADTVKMEQTQ
jgi:uncharacterized protein YdeI (BOF family)